MGKEQENYNCKKVINAKSLGSAKKIAFVANSPLVKTAVAGGPELGRVIMGIGKSGEMIDIKKLKVKFGDFVVAENGKISIIIMKKSCNTRNGTQLLLR